MTRNSPSSQPGRAGARARSIPLVLIALAFPASSAWADVSDYVFIPYADSGVKRLDLLLASDRNRNGTQERGEALGFGINPGADWFTELYASWYKEPAEPTSFYAWTLVNHYQILRQGSSPLDMGAYLAVERPRDRSEGYDITFGPTWQFDSEHGQLNVNLQLEKSVATHAAPPMALKYQWQFQCLWRPGVEIGLQGLGSPGPWNHWNAAGQQEHSLGPHMTVKWRAGAGTIKAEAALLFGLNSATARSQARGRVQFEF